jgi:hypothetical protein
MGQAVPLPDFDFLVALHSQDEQAFEAFRAHLLEDTIAQAPEEHRPGLRALLKRINAARAQASNPMEAALIANRMMQDRLRALGDAWSDLRGAVAQLQTGIVIERARLGS